LTRFHSGTVDAHHTMMLHRNALYENPRAVSSQTPGGRLETSRLDLPRRARTQPRIMACVTSDAASGTRLFEQAVVSAKELDAELFAVYVGGHRNRGIEREQINRNLTLFSSAGAKVVRLAGSDAADRFLEFARAHGVTRMLVPRDRQAFLSFLFERELWREIVRKGTGFQIQIVGLREPRAPRGLEASTQRIFEGDSQKLH
jgi:K+-sensing histidine kinase KdpD